MKRKVLLINPRFQLRFMGYVVAIALFAIGVFFVADWVFFTKLISTGRAMGLPPDHIYFAFISHQQRTMTTIYLFTTLFALGSMGLIGLLISHRVAGPLHRLRSHMDAVAEGRTTADVSFRKGDFFPEIADSYNRQLRKLTSDKTS